VHDIDESGDEAVALVDGQSFAEDCFDPWIVSK
jgi:hypothetical protein